MTLPFARYLHENGFPVFEYVGGQRADGWTHAWIESKRLIVDLAAGQFPDAPELVMVTRNRSWHAQFKEQIRHRAEIGIYDENTRGSLLEAYEQIISNLPQ